MLGDHLTRGRSLMSQRRPSTLVDGNKYNNNYDNNYDNYYNDYNNNFSDLEEMNNLLGDRLTRGRSLMSQRKLSTLVDSKNYNNNYNNNNYKNNYNY